jgi:hypothetical protein
VPADDREELCAELVGFPLEVPVRIEHANRSLAALPVLAPPRHAQRPSPTIAAGV